MHLLPTAKPCASASLPSCAGGSSFYCFVLFIVNYLDRVNVGFAATHMNKDLGLSATAYGFGAGVFFLGYIAFEIPSNMMMHKVGARIWIARIMVTWGLISCAMAFIQGETSFYILRFLLGAAEAGFVPASCSI